MPHADIHNDTLIPILKTQFGHESLRPLQKQIVNRVMNGRDALVVMPTGSGKSLCYQLPALALPGDGITLVFSPLIALMEDQVAALKNKGIRAVYINSSLSRKQRETRYAAVAKGEYDLVYATPERMQKPEFAEALATVPGGVKLLAVDEAHCITRWGHDLRPAYQDVGLFRKQLGNPVIIALTATATAAVRADIRLVLDRTDDDMPLFASSIERPNLTLATSDVWDDDARLTSIARIADANPGTRIVYFALIKDLERMADRIRRTMPDRNIAIYHGKLEPRTKKYIYREFIEATPDDRLILLATNAFGMGVDKPDIRFIIHAQVPGSVEAYFQEIGRAGRDGQPAHCELLYNQDDLAIQQQFAAWKNPSAELLAQTATTIEASPHADFDAEELRLEVIGRNRGDRRLEYCLIELEKRGVIEPTGIENRWRFVHPLDLDTVDPATIAEKQQRDLARLLDVVHLVKSENMQAFVIDYFDLTPTSPSV